MRNYFSLRNRKGFTLIELIMVTGVIAIMTTIILVVINPNRQLAGARDVMRKNNGALTPA